MKFLVFCLLTVAVIGVVGTAPLDIELLRYESDNDGLGNYTFFFDITYDGNSRDETGTLINEGSKDESITVSGSFSWFGPDGKQYGSNYIADKSGYRVFSLNAPSMGSAQNSLLVASLLG